MGSRPAARSRRSEAQRARSTCDGGRCASVFGKPSTLIGIPYDRPVVGYGGKTINTLRLWAAAAPDDFDFAFSSGDFVGALAETLTAETFTRVLYPDDHTTQGKGLRFLQEYFLVACSLADLVRRFRAAGNDWSALPDKVAIQLNDTHPTLAVPELMRLLLDEAEAWAGTTPGISRNARWPTPTTRCCPKRWRNGRCSGSRCCCRAISKSFYEINRRLLDEVRTRFPGDGGRVDRVSLVEDAGERKVRMAHLAIVGSHSTNGVAAIHSDCSSSASCRISPTCSPSASTTRPTASRRAAGCCWPTRRWPAVITDAIGDGWITDLAQLAKLKPLADDKAFCDAVRKAKRDAKARFTDWLKATAGLVVDPDTRFSTARSSASTSTSGNC